MMWIVRLALRRPYTFAVSALLLVILGVYSTATMPTDIFPDIDIPVVTVAWSYNGMPAEQIASRIVTINERTLTTVVSDVEHIESQSLPGMGIIKIFFQPSANVGIGIAQVTAVCQTQLRTLPPGITPPMILQFSASAVPVLQIGISGEGLNEQQLNDLSNTVIRTQLATVEGAQMPYPFGGKARQVIADLDLQAMQAKGLAPGEVVNALGAQNLITSTGTVKIDRFEYSVETNSAPSLMDELNSVPIKTQNGAVTYLRDVAHLHDGSPPQQNVVRVDGKRAVMLNLMKTGSASTLKIVEAIHDKLRIVKDRLPPQMQFANLVDQSIFVRASVDGVVYEAIIAACLTAIMVLIFLGSWRSTIIIAISIPLSILGSLIMLKILGQTINLMTLGGFALAVGILVDDATVTIENINRNLEMGKETEQAILDGAAEIVMPALVSTLSICIVFVPMFFLSGVAKYLFVPMAEAVVFAMLTSYLISRTIVPVMAKYMLHEHDDQEVERRKVSRNPYTRFLVGFEAGFTAFRNGYLRVLTLCVDHAAVFLPLFLLFAVGSVAAIGPMLGQDFFPAVDSGAFKIHLRSHSGTRIEENAALCDRIEQTIRGVIPPEEISTIVDNIGMPTSAMNIAYMPSTPIGPSDADIQVQLTHKHHPSEGYLNQLRVVLGQQYPGVTFYAVPVDIVTQILNFGIASPIDLQLVGPNQYANRALAEKMANEIRYIPGAVDVHIQQPFDLPKLNVNIDRVRAAMVGLTTQNVTQSLLVALSGSSQTTPSYYLDPKNGVSYSVATMMPQYKMDSLDDLKSLPVTGTNTLQTAPLGAAMNTAPGVKKMPQVLGNLMEITPSSGQGLVSHYDVQPVIDIMTNISGSDLGSVTRQVEQIIDRHRKDLPVGTLFTLRGQSETMHSSYVALLSGLAFSILLVYLLIVVNFQSWLDPFIIVSALPAALGGIAWMLFLTGTRLSVPALTGAIMCMGVATANSILVVNFARDQMNVLVGDSRQSALNAGFVRLRPVVMTALAMMIGMVPMALGIGDGGEQNAPLGRAVIGGLALATVATLLFVPTFFAAVHGWTERRRKKHIAIRQAGVIDEFATTLE